MKTISYTTEDKSSWGPGPWQSEPDKLQWQDPASGLACLIKRGPIGALCGYVGLERSHPVYGLGYDEAERQGKLDCHGGLTYADGCDHSPNPAKGICHLPDEGEPDDLWWLGFDCAHPGDYIPKHNHYRRYGMNEDSTYKDLAYVQAQVTSLARQLAST